MRVSSVICAVLHGHVEVDADQHPLPSHVDILDGLLLESRTTAPRIRLMVSGKPRHQARLAM